MKDKMDKDIHASSASFKIRKQEVKIEENQMDEEKENDSQ